MEAGPARAADNGETRSIFVGNLAYRASKDELEQLFGQYGVVRSVRIMTDRMTRRPRGFGFVEMEAKSALAAIKALDGKEFHGRALKVNEGNERRPRESQAA
nr:RNA-binding protein [Sulfurivermis fontis]